MKKLDNDHKQEIFGGSISAATLFAIGATVATAISLASNIIFGTLNIINAKKQKEPDKQLEFSRNFDHLAYTKIL